MKTMMPAGPRGKMKTGSPDAGMMMYPTVIAVRKFMTCEKTNQHVIQDLGLTLVGVED